MRALLRALGRPQHAYRSIIVAGTNGKGSTSAMLASILHSSGYRTALYTSPHLVDLRERWWLDGEMIEEPLLERCIELLRGAAEKTSITPTYFEALTLIAFVAFREAGCELAVLEVGMGGRLDATNVVRPIASIITPIGFDHTEFLGTTISKIAAEKAGVIHRRSIVLTSNDDPQIVAVLRRRAEKFGNRFILVHGRHDTPLDGEFQRRNAALAVRTAEELRRELPRLTPRTIERGVAATSWRGRLERVDRQGKEIWIDGCHNEHAVATISSFIGHRLRRPRLLVFGVMKDKNVEAIADILFPLFDRVITTEPFPPRSASAEDLASMARARGIAAEAVREPSRAIEQALRSGERAIFIGGSLYLAGAAIQIFDAQREERSEENERREEPRAGNR